MKYVFLIITLTLIVGWSATINWRIIHARTKQTLLSVAFLLAFWYLVKFIKWHFVEDPGIARMLWYLYYVPFLIIPALSLLIAVSLRKSENYRTPLFVRIVFAVSVAMVALVQTNDLHQLVFSFPPSVAVWSDFDYNYEAGYFVVAAWALLCEFGAVLTMFQKMRAKKTRKAFAVPIISLSALLLYGALYVQHLIPHIYPIYDMTLVFCVCIIVTFEGCIQSGLIPSNTHYAELFRLSTIDGQITDGDFQVQLASGNSCPLREETMRLVVKEPVVTKEQTRIAAAQLKAGYVFWQEDISEISQVISELADMNEYLTTRKDALQKEVDTSRKERQLEEKNRLYNVLMDETSDEIDSFEELLDRIGQTEDTEELRRLTKKLALICTHIKRRSNLFFLAEENDGIEADELYHALEEWLSNLRLGGIVCGSVFDIKSPLAFSELLFLYDTFQVIMLRAVDSLKNLFVNCRETENELSLLINLTCEADFSAFHIPGARVCDADGEEWVLEITLPKGGAGI